MTELKAGFSYPWISWDGIEGIGENAGTILVDGMSVPATFTECDSRQEPHNPGHNRCHNNYGNYGFTFGFRLDNGIVALIVADDHDAPILLTDDETLKHPITFEGDHARVVTECLGPDCEQCTHWNLVVWLSFETRSELLGILERLRAMELRDA